MSFALPLLSGHILKDLSSVFPKLCIKYVYALYGSYVLFYFPYFNIYILFILYWYFSLYQLSSFSLILNNNIYEITVVESLHMRLSWSTCNAGNTGDVDLVPGSGRSPGKGNGNPLQYSCLENFMDRGVWQATVHVATDTTEAIEYTHTHMHHNCICFLTRNELKL